MPNVKINSSKISASAKSADWQKRRARLAWRAKLPLWIGSAVLSCFLLLHLHILPFATILERFERANFDLFFQLRGSVPPDSRIHLVVIDEVSVKEIGSWPWPRATQAKLLEKVLASNAKLVVYDSELYNKPEDAEGTNALAQVAASSEKVIFPYHFSGFGQSAKTITLPEKIRASNYSLFDFPEKFSSYPVVEAATMIPSADVLVSASRPGGHINVFREEQFGEATVRWEAQIIRYGEAYFPSLPVKAAMEFLDLTGGQIQVQVGSGIQIAGKFVPTDRRGWTLINYYGAAQTFPQTSAAVILKNAPAAHLNGKLVFVGVTASAVKDFLQTPAAMEMPGVEKLATSTSNILQENALTRNATIENFELLIFAALGLSALFSARRLPRLYAGVALLGLVLLAWVGAFGFFTLSRIWMKPIGMMLAIIATGSVTAIVRRKVGVAQQIAYSINTGGNEVIKDAKGELVRLGRFEIIGEIGSGAMGKIYEGFDPAINRRVAVKTIRGDLSDNSQRVRQRFLREAQAAGALNHPNIVTIYQADEAGPYSFIAMEFLEGGTFEDVIKTRAPMPLAEICRLVTPVCEALDYAHRNGVVHRDIKPANLMLTSEAVVKVMDFGIAHVDYSTLTLDGAVLGTPSYMSPEQISGDKVDGQSDIFSLGVILYEMATGQRPFLGDSLATISNRILSQVPIRASDLNANLSPAFDAALTQAMAKDKSKRFTTAKEFAEALQMVAALRNM